MGRFVVLLLLVALASCADNSEPSIAVTLTLRFDSTIDRVSTRDRVDIQSGGTLQAEIRNYESSLDWHGVDVQFERGTDESWLLIGDLFATASPRYAPNSRHSASSGPRLPLTRC